MQSLRIAGGQSHLGCSFTVLGIFSFGFVKYFGHNNGPATHTAGIKPDSMLHLFFGIIIC